MLGYAGISVTPISSPESATVTAPATITDTWTPTGGVVVSGTAAIGRQGSLFPAGGTILGGNSAYSKHISFGFHGGAFVGGDAVIVRKFVHATSGGAVSGGTSAFVSFSAMPHLPTGSVICIIKTAPLQYYTFQDRLLDIGTIRKPMGGIIGNLENANASITLDNSDGLLSDLFLPPPIGIRVVITGSGMHDVPYFTGIITGITIGEAISLNLEAGERIPLSAQIPLLSTTQLPGYRTDQSIPIVYGTVTLQPVSADSTGYIYLAAGHPCAQVEAVMIDNAEIQAWSWKNSINEAGTMATISLTTSLQANQRITCRVRGKQSLRSGALITNPADVVWDILANVCGISIEYSELDRFRTDMAAKGITLSGAIVDARKTIRSTLDEIMISCGSVWSGQVPGIALDYLGAIQEPPSAVITANQINSLQISAKLSEIATSLKMSYAYNFSQNQHTKTALFDCAAGIKQLGRTIVDLEASWLSSTRNAVILGEQYLQWKATPQWSISISTGGEHKSIRPGQWITAIHPHLPGGQITSLCINAELDITKGGINLLFIVPAGVVYPVSLGSLSTAFDPQTMEGTQIQFANGQATITFMDDKGSALAGAQVTLDGSQTKTTDKNGKVSFSTARGMHNIKVVATGYQPMEGSIEI